MISVDEAQAQLLALHDPLAPENIALPKAFGRYISEDLVAGRDQPAAALSAMDGYAIRFDDLPGPWIITGTVAAGTPPLRSVSPGEAMRIFTGAILPNGADTILVQEDAASDGNNLILLGDGPSERARHVRAQATDFASGTRLLSAGTRLTPAAIAAAAMGSAGELRVGGCPRVAILTTGDELIAPGGTLAPGQIPDSNGVMLAAMLAAESARVDTILHAHDDRDLLSNILNDLARDHDVIVTVGGASVGDHDHIRGALQDAGGRIDFWKIAMRPGKPLIAGSIGDAVLLGLPGNPSSAFVTATLFLLPLVRHLGGARDPLPPVLQAPLAVPLAAGDSRRAYLRARLDAGRLTPFAGQDSGQVFPLIAANALIIREIDAPRQAAADMADYIAIA